MGESSRWQSEQMNDREHRGDRGPQDDALWCGLCGEVREAMRCPNCDYCICHACRENGRCLCGATACFDPAAVRAPSELVCLRAVREVTRAAAARRLAPGGHVVSRLAAEGYDAVAVRGCLERLYDAGLIDCLSIQLPWLTAAGRARLAALEASA